MPPRPDTIQSSQAGVCRVGDCDVFVQSNRIVRSGIRIDVEPRMMQVLVLLMERPGETVTYQELRDRIWAGTFVEDDSLRRTVYHLRKALGDKAQSPRYIETIRKTGYRLVAPITGDDRRVTPTTGRKRPRRAAFTLLLLLILAPGIVPLLKPSLVQPMSPTLPTPLTTSPGIETHPALSPDGNWVAYVAPGDSGLSDLMVQRADQLRARRIDRPETSESAPAWSPDGSRIAFIRRSRRPDESCAIISALPSGEDETILWECSGQVYSGLDWSPDGRRLAFAVRPSANEPFRVVLFEIETGHVRFLSNPDSGVPGDVRPAFSPDGKSLAFVRAMGGREHDLFVLSLNENRLHRLTRDSVLVAGYDWLPGSRSLVFSSNRAGNFKFWRVGLDGAPAVWVPSPVTYDPGQTSISSQGQAVYEEWSFDFNIVRLTFGSDSETTAEEIAASTRWDLDPAVSHEGSQLVFSSNRGGSTELWLAGADGGDAVRLTSFRERHVSAPDWSPDGRTVVFEGHHSAETAIYLVDEVSGQPRKLVPSGYAPAWSQDGTRILFTSRMDGVWKGFEISREGGVAQSLPLTGITTLREAPDREHFFYTRNGERGLWRSRRDGSEEQLVVESLEPTDAQNWAVSETGIYYVGRIGKADRILFHDFQDGAHRTIWEAPDPIPAGKASLSTSRDGSVVYVTQIARLESDLFLAIHPVGT